MVPEESGPELPPASLAADAGVAELRPPESEYGPTGPGTVLLELGRDVGALVLMVPAYRNGAEIEISRDDPAGQPRQHAQVRARPAADGTTYAAVYAGLPAGRYLIWRDQQTRGGIAEVAGGQVTTVDWQ
jgi:hypothetical protein